MKKFIIICWVLILSSCSGELWFLSNTDINPEFIEYTKDFEKLCGIPVTGRKIQFSDDLGSNYVGWCVQNNIFVDKEAWDRYDSDGRRIILYHELGHCVLNRRHDDRLVELSGIPEVPKSLMNSFPLRVLLVYKMNKDYYHKELCP